jgi:dTDP-4-amino-4,6-dideoxygalactose transaminase
MRPKYPIFSPSFGDAELAAVERVVRSGWIAQAEEVARFEALVAARLDVAAERVVAVSSGTAALHVSLVVAGIGPGDDVLVPALGFIATANAVTYCGARPVFVDCDSRAFTSGVDDFRAAVTPQTRAVIPVHNCGRMAPVHEIVPWARDAGLVVVEDAAPAMGASLLGRAAGAWGDFGCFSLHSSKPVTAGEGGVVIASTVDAADRARRLRFHGASVYDFTEVDFGAMWEEEYPEVGFNYRMTDLQAAIASVQVGRLDDFLATRRSLCEHYDGKLADVAALDTVAPIPGPCASAWQQYVVRLVEADRRLRDAVIAGCRARGAFVMPGVSFLPAQPLWGERARRDAEPGFPAAFRAEVTALSLPLSTAMSRREVEEVVEILAASLAAAGRR